MTGITTKRQKQARQQNAKKAGLAKMKKKELEKYIIYDSSDSDNDNVEVVDDLNGDYDDEDDFEEIEEIQAQPKAKKNTRKAAPKKQARQPSKRKLEAEEKAKVIMEAIESIKNDFKKRDLEFEEFRQLSKVKPAEISPPKAEAPKAESQNNVMKLTEITKKKLLNF